MIIVISRSTTNLFDTMNFFLNFLKEFFETVNFEKKLADDNKSMTNYIACKDLKVCIEKSGSWVGDADSSLFLKP